MSNTLHRLFTFAKATGASPLENFTTEALAAAIRSDASPLLEVLRREKLVPLGERAVTKVSTQVQVPGGVVDLEVVLDGGEVFWVEVKAHAGEHGHQLQNYRSAAERDHRHPTLVMLCKRRLRDDVTTIRWNELRDEMANSDNLRWSDLKQFIEKYAMADDFDKPITLEELAAAKVTRALLAKTVRLARELFEVQPIANAIDFPKSNGTMASTIALQYSP